MEEGNQSGELAINGGHGNAQEEYAMRRRRIVCSGCSLWLGPRTQILSRA